jgi:hypothetical protein
MYVPPPLLRHSSDTVLLYKNVMQLSLTKNSLQFSVCTNGQKIRPYNLKGPILKACGRKGKISSAL